MSWIPTIEASTYVRFTGRVVDGKGQGVNQTTVQIFRSDTNEVYATYYTDAQGNFDFSKPMSSGLFFVRVSKSGYTSKDSTIFLLSVTIPGYIEPNALTFGDFQIRGYPIVNIYGSYAGITNTPIQFSSAGTYDPDSSQISYEWNFGDEQISYQAYPTHAYTDPGTYTVRLTVRDELRLERYATTTVFISSNPPTSMPNGPYFAETTDIILFNGSESYDDGSIINYRWDFEDGSNYSYGWNVTHVYIEPGNYSVTLMVTDNHNLTAINTTKAYITTKPPVVDINGPYSEYATDSVQFSSMGTYDPDGNFIEYVWTFGDGSNSTEPNPSHTYLFKGNYKITLTVNDSYNATTIATTYADISPKPPVAQIDGILLGKSGETIQFISSSYDFDTRIVEYKWSYGDDSGIFFEENPNHIYISPGNYTVTLTVIDEDGLDNTVTSTVIIENIDPIAVIVVPESPEAESPLVFSSRGSSDTDGMIVSYLWEFGDGETSTEANPEYTYMAEGTYSVKLTVTDDFGGKGTIIVTVMVTPKTFPMIYIVAVLVITVIAAGYYFYFMKKRE